MKKKQNILFLSSILLFSFLLFFVVEAKSQSNPFLNGRSSGGNRYAADKKTVLIVFDASGSMRDTINGESKIQIAKRVLEKVLLEADVSLNVGLRVYGASGLTRNAEVNCSDTRLLIRPDTDNRRSIIQAVENITPEGLTPITFSLVQAIHDLVPYAGEKSIVLISDGLETCNFDPCILAGKMKKNGIDIKIDVVGFGIKSDKDALRQLKCVALSTNGRFFSADTAAELASGLADSFNTNVSGRVITNIKTPTDTHEELKQLPNIESEKIDINLVK